MTTTVPDEQTLVRMMSGPIKQEIVDLTKEHKRLSGEQVDLIERNGEDPASWEPGQSLRFENNERGLARMEDKITQLRTEQAAYELRIHGVAADPANLHPGAPGAGPPHRRTGSVGGDAAMRLVDGYQRSGELPTDAAEKVERLLKRTDSAGAAVEYVTTVGAPAYRSAFLKLLGDPERGHLLWTTEEHAAYVAAEDWGRAAMSTTVGNGGYLIPLTLDPTVILTSNGSINPLRRIARTVETMTGQWKGISSAGTTMEWKAEAAQAADGSFTVDDEPIPVHLGSVYVQYSFELEGDARNLTSEIQRVMLDAVEQGQNLAYTTGDGSGEPTGIVYALSSAAGSKVAAITPESFTAPDVYAVQNALPPRFQPNAQWCAALPTINTIAQFETTNGALKFPEVGAGQLLRRPLNELSNMDSSINVAATENNYILLYGDFTNFVIVDQVGGSRIELEPLVKGANGRPTGERGLYLWHRSGSDSVNDAAFRVLNVATTA